MGFNEKTHAFIAAKYFVYLTERFQERGRSAFIHATQYYGSQRGRRMAQRAIRDGQALSFGNYLRYGEWVNTEEIREQGCANAGRLLTGSPDYMQEVTVCPWNTQFREMGLLEAGETYCLHLDNAICRGFNPYLSYRVPQNLNQGVPCYHIVAGANVGDGPFPKNPASLRSFAYHCGHSYWAYREVAEAIFGEEGTELAEKVLADFSETYGKEMAQTLRSYADTNFNVLDDSTERVPDADRSGVGAASKE